MTKPDDIPEDVWGTASVVWESAADADTFDESRAIIARAIMAKRRSRYVLVALNAKDEVRAMANLNEPWAIEEFIATLKGWAEVPERRIAIRKGGA